MDCSRSAGERENYDTLTETEKKDVLQELEDCLATPALTKVSESIKQRFKEYAARDVEDLILI